MIKVDEVWQDCFISLHKDLKSLKIIKCSGFTQSGNIFTQRNSRDRLQNSVCQKSKFQYLKFAHLRIKGLSKTPGGVVELHSA